MPDISDLALAPADARAAQMAHQCRHQCHNHRSAIGVRGHRRPLHRGYAADALKVARQRVICSVHARLVVGLVFFLRELHLAMRTVRMTVGQASSEP
jgi:hypothetical protein